MEYLTIKFSKKVQPLTLRSISSRRFELWGLALIIALFVTVAATSAQTETYQFVSKWGNQGTGDGEFDHPYDIILDNSKHTLH